jgi:hypothetical protein
MKFNILIALLFVVVTSLLAKKKRKNKKFIMTGTDKPVPCKWHFFKDECKEKFGKHTRCDEMINECRKENGQECYVFQNANKVSGCLTYSDCVLNDKSQDDGWGKCVNSLSNIVAKAFGLN